MSRTMILKAAVIAVTAVMGASSCNENQMLPEGVEAKTFHIFRDNVIHFAPDDSSKYDTASVWASDNGRVISSYFEAPSYDMPVRITARMVIKPIPKDMTEVHDRWDRAGNVRLATAGGPDVELIKFVTSYGGRTEHEMDVSYLAPLLRGTCTIKGFIDTWVSPGWKIDFTLIFEPMPLQKNPVWAEALIYEESFNRQDMDRAGVEASVVVPDTVRDVRMMYFVSGHCTDGRDADEFITKDNVIYLDGKEAHRFRPWRDDCLRFRALNPYCRRWSDGSWSSDYSRSGWCPGDVVRPVEIDLSGRLGPGRHTLRFDIEDIRPVDENGHFGYWRVSAFLTGRKK